MKKVRFKNILSADVEELFKEAAEDRNILTSAKNSSKKKEKKQQHDASCC